MSELDIVLASEFSKRHGLYDKNSPHYKDKIYSENAWKEISNQLGYNVSMLKDRMIQLRNRYNVEKRKYDFLRSQNPNVKAPWKLFYHLNFLEGHIKQRRSRSLYYGDSMSGSIENQMGNSEDCFPEQPVTFVRRRGRPPKFLKELEEQQNAHSSVPGLNGFHSGGLPEDFIMNGDLVNSTVIKEEYTSESENSNDKSEDQFLNPASLLQQSEEEFQSDEYPPATTPAPSTQSQQQDNTSTSPPPMEPTTPQVLTNGTSAPTASTTTPLSVVATSALTNTNHHHHRLHQPHHQNKISKKHLIAKWHRAPCKFQAFGQFVSASLSDMPEEKALKLIEQFTFELVEKMRKDGGGTRTESTNGTESSKENN